MKRFLYVSFIITSFLRGFSQSSIILPNGNVIPSMTQANRPTNNLTVGQLIYQTDGISGLYLWNGTTWTLVGSGSGNGTVTSVTATTPLSVTNGSTTPQISLSQASSSTNGFLSSTDWTTFNNKQNALANASATTSGILTSTDWTTFNNKQNALANASATTSGILTNTDWTTFNNKQNALANASATTSGILTITDWTTFNNKQNALANASATTSGILTSADWTTFNNKQNALANASATTSGILTNTDWTTFNNKQNALANASATTSGILTSTDWTTFNNKFTLPSLTDGSILFSNGTTIDQNNGSLKWTNSIRRLDVRGLNDGTVGAGFTNWISTTIGGSGGNRIVMGIQNGEATIGAHNEALNAWAKLVLNPAGTTAVGSLVGTGTRMVVANNLGELTTQAIPTATADNLGNHTATQNININNNWISNNGTNAGIKMENTGKVIITNGNPNADPAFSTGTVTTVVIDPENNITQSTFELNGNTQPRQLVVNGSIRQSYYTVPVSVPGISNPTGNEIIVTWNHNLGYGPIVMMSTDGNGVGAGSQMERVTYTTYNNNVNQTIFKLYNASNAPANGNFRWIIVH